MKDRERASNYKPAADREKDLRLALLRIQKGRSRTGGTKVTITAVAREAGVSTALIHNYYPKFAEAIREIMGRSSRAMRDTKQQALIAERKKSKAYRLEIEELRAKVANLASINEVLLSEIRAPKAKISDRKTGNLAVLTPNS